MLFKGNQEPRDGTFKTFQNLSKGQGLKLEIHNTFPPSKHPILVDKFQNIM